VSDVAEPEIEDQRDDDDDERAEKARQSSRHVFRAPQASIAPTAASQIQELEPPSPLPHRPVFLQPPSPAKAPAEPLPEAFSPHRRGQKFVPGGMAAEVRQWVLDTSQISTHPKRSSFGENLWRVRVLESNGAVSESIVLAKGVIEGREVKIILPGAGKSKSGVGVAVGDVVGIKPPTWEVVLDGEAWVVAADWRTMNEKG
jgi:hypothetical protein